LRRRCIRANSGILWDDHGNVLKRVIRSPGEIQGVAKPTTIMLEDILNTWDWVCEKTLHGREGDEDAVEVTKEVTAQIIALWDRAVDDIVSQSDKCIDLLAEHLLVDIPRARRKRT
jgi:hypothetical protein